MGAKRIVIWSVCVALLLLAGCAANPELESRRMAMEADIDEILGLSATPGLAAGERCLADHKYRHFRPLGDRYLLFEGRRGQMWVNKLRMRCPDLRHGHVMMVDPFSSTRICDMDRFQVSDWFYWPWYRRWRPWHWGPAWGTGAFCSLGKFYPVTEGQVTEIEAVLKRR